ncbi:MAG: cellulase family glycosylhydrolase [Phycisphaeraceae bacterium]|nr:cellulase family glycosylhydrolase [Phycisphaeraceae bacterium]
MGSPTRWSVERARAWEQQQPWFFGANFTPSTAVNQLEMWQGETFDPETIDRELGYARAIGMNLMRVYLHDLLWEHDREGFVERIERYLEIADGRGIGTMFVLFDDCWNGGAALGPQPDPIPFTHNSRWLQSPGHEIVEDPSRWPRLERYVTELLTRFRDDPRVVVWDLYNEPGNGTEGDANDGSLRGDRSVPLMAATFAWARSVEGLTQPVTMGLWSEQPAVNECLLTHSDIITFHSYDPPVGGLEERMDRCLAEGRPTICTEYMSRVRGSTFEACTALMKERGVGAINWGLVAGKTQTYYPWGWGPEKGEPDLLMHDIFEPDGSYLYPKEEAVIRAVASS